MSGLRAFSRKLFAAIAIFTAALFQVQHLSYSLHESRHAAYHFQEQGSSSHSVHDGNCGLCAAHQLSGASMQLEPVRLFRPLPEARSEMFPFFLPASVQRFSFSARGPPSA